MSGKLVKAEFICMKELSVSFEWPLMVDWPILTCLILLFLFFMAKESCTLLLSSALAAMWGEKMKLPDSESFSGLLSCWACMLRVKTLFS